MLIVSHNLENFAFADRVLTVAGGKVVQDGAPAALRTKPGPYQDAVIGIAAQSLQLLDLSLESGPEGDWRLKKNDGKSGV